MTNTLTTHGQEWQDQNETCNFPFSDTATLTNSAGDFIPEGMFLDAVLHPLGAAHRMYLSKVIVTSETTTLVVGDATSDTVASAVIGLAPIPDSVALVDALGRSAGILVSEANRLSGFQAWDIGEHVFLPSQTEFVARVCQPLPDYGLQGFLLEDGTILDNNVWIVGDDGVIVRFEQHEVEKVGFTSEVETIAAIRIDVVGDPLFRRKLCADIFETPRFLQSITFESADTSFEVFPDTIGSSSNNRGNLTIGISSESEDVSNPTVDTIMRIRTTPGGIKFELAGQRYQV